MGVNMTTTRMATLTNDLSMIVTRFDVLLEPEEAQALSLAQILFEMITWHNGFLLDGELVARQPKPMAKVKGDSNEQQVQQ